MGYREALAPMDRNNAEHHIPKVRERLENSKSKYIRVIKFSQLDRAALRIMIERGEAEIFESPLGRAYRLCEVS